MTIDTPQHKSLEGTIATEPALLKGTLTITRADSVKVEPSETLKYLRMRNGDFECYSRVLVSVEGEWKEITVDCLPTQEEQGSD